MQEIDADGDGQVDDVPVFQVTFHADAGTTAAFDSLVMESTGDDFFGDDTVTGFDDAMTLFDSSGKWLASNTDDRYPHPGRADGSTNDQLMVSIPTFSILFPRRATI
jgi:hypothetical protein